MEALQVIALFFGIAADMAIFFLVLLLFREYINEEQAESQEENEEYRRMRAKAEAFDEMMKQAKKGDDPFSLGDDDVEN